MNSQYLICRASLKSIIDWYELNFSDKERNEATTRLHLIDRLMFESLGWDREDCIVEEPYRNEYTDYSLFCPHRALIIEAKKEGFFFELPAGYKKLEYSLTYLCKDNVHIKKAVEQTMNYCQTRGTSLGAICNGYQFICFVATRDDGKPPLEGKVIIFISLQNMLDHFNEFWKYLSKPGVQENNVKKKILGSSIPQLPSKLSASIISYPGNRNRNIIQTDLQIVGELVIEDITNTREIESDFIRICYCLSGALSQYALISKSILVNRYTALFDEEINGPTLISATTRKGLSSEILAESLSKRPILLIGDVGVGKTMFIRYIIKVVGIEVINKAIAIYVNLGSQATLSPSLWEFLLREIEKQLLENYEIDIFERNFVRGVYHLELLRFSRSIFSDIIETDKKNYRLKEIEFLKNKIDNKEEHIKNCLNHISKGQKKQIVIFIDNADQRDEEIQEQAFIISQDIASNWPVTVFLAIRPQTFYLSKKSGKLSGYHPKAFSISPPRVDEVINKRLNFALEIAKGELSIKNLSPNITTKFEKLEKYLNVLLYSFDINKELIEFIDNVCIGNIRLALEFITTFIGSGHVDTKKILDIEEKEERYNRHYLIPMHEFLRAVIYGDHIFYDPKTSVFANVFDITTPDGREHFLLPILIEFVGRAASLPNSEGFVEIIQIYKYAQCSGFTKNQIDSSLYRSIHMNLLESKTKNKADVKNLPESLRATSVGIYHVIKLVRLFTYIDAIIIDTPILDSNFRQKIKNVNNIEDRLTRTSLFCDYLDEQWINVNTDVIGFDWSEISIDLRKNINDINNKINIS